MILQNAIERGSHLLDQALTKDADTHTQVLRREDLFDSAGHKSGIVGALNEVFFCIIDCHDHPIEIGHA